MKPSTDSCGQLATGVSKKLLALKGPMSFGRIGRRGMNPSVPEKRRGIKTDKTCSPD